MDKSKHFFGNSVFGQLISLIDTEFISQAALKHRSEHDFKRFKTKDHLISMLFCAFAKCTSLREVSGAMLGLSGKTKHFKLESIPYRSTLSDANMRRSSDVFLYHIKNNTVYAAYNVSEINKIEDNMHSGVLEDVIIDLTVKDKTGNSVLKLRKVKFYDRILKRTFEFLTNMFEMRPDLIAAIYKLRWQIELLFKQFKQNFPLKYFIGDNENAIKIQIYCALIANLLMTVIQKMLKRSWAFSNLVSFCKIHLFNYIHLLRFLENPDKDWTKEILKSEQLVLF